MSDGCLSYSVKEVGVDYITATSHQASNTSPLVSFGRWVVSEEVSRGCKDSDFRATGYHGRHAGGAVYGVSHQGGIVKLSAECAREYWAQLLQLADNVTRLDLQVTVRNVAGPTATLSRHHKELLRAPRNRGKEAKFKAFYGPTGIEGLHIGRRCSDRFGRAYDKGLESGLEEYLGCIRYELELHRAIAFKTALRLDSQELDQALIMRDVHTFMATRGLRLPVWSQVSPEPAESVNCLTGFSRSFFSSSPEVAPEVIRALKWLSNSVRPSVQRLVESGHGERVLRALGLSTEGKADIDDCGPLGPTS